jgi:hypothetical protein
MLASTLLDEPADLPTASMPAVARRVSTSIGTLLTSRIFASIWSRSPLRVLIWVALTSTVGSLASRRSMSMMRSPI